MDFVNPRTLNDLDYHRLTGLSETDFNNLFDVIKIKIRNTSCRSAKTCLTLLLIEIRTSMSQSILSTIFGLSRRAVRRAIIHSAKQARPYFADDKNNNASILNSLMPTRNSELLEWLWTEDVMVVDRRFRDSITILEEQGLIPKIPHFLDKGKQHDTESENESRLVSQFK